MGKFLHGNGAYIVLEGGEGLGKTTVIKRLVKHYSALATREPGGTEIGAQIRAITHYSANLHPTTELLLMASDRAQHISEVVMPAIKDGLHVISDRSWISSLVYQGKVRGLGEDKVRSINKAAIGKFMKPDLLLILHAPREVVNARRKKLGREQDRFEHENENFHQSVVDAYLGLADTLQAIIIDASGTPDQVFSLITREIDGLLMIRGRDAV